MKQWISTNKKKDSVLIYDDLLYYGKLPFSTQPEILDQQEITSELASIPLSYLKRVQINHKTKVTILEYGKKSDLSILIRWEDQTHIREFKDFILNHYPGAFILSGEKKAATTTRKPVFAMIAIVILYVIVLASGTEAVGYSTNMRTNSVNAFKALCQAIASLGPITVTILFVLLFLIALNAFFRAGKTNEQLTIIQLKRD